MQLGQRGVGRRRASRECGVRRGTRIYGFAKRVELLEGDVPLAGEDVAGELAPVCRDGEIRVGGEDAEVVEIVGSPAIVPVRVLEFAKVVERSNLLERDLRWVGVRVRGEGMKEDSLGTRPGGT